MNIEDQGKELLRRIGNNFTHTNSTSDAASILMIRLTRPINNSPSDTDTIETKYSIDPNTSTHTVVKPIDPDDPVVRIISHIFDETTDDDSCQNITGYTINL